MNFLEHERKRIVLLRDQLFDDPGNGLFIKIPRPFVLNDPQKNLFEPIRSETLNYFQKNHITWWNDHGAGPTGHLLSSQIACLNHLFFLRGKREIATEVIKGVSKSIVKAEVVDDGFVEFEVIGKRNYLGEKSHQRGANSTSVDAVMVGKKDDGQNVLVMIEWKYTESYKTVDKYIPARARIYDRLIMDPDSPIRVDDPQDLYFEPYYQLMRQTLLGWQMVRNREYDCDEYIHIHIIPEDNQELRIKNTSPGLSGGSMSEIWKSVLKDPSQYLVISPDDFLGPLVSFQEAHDWHAYLSERYWRSV